MANGGKYEYYRAQSETLIVKKIREDAVLPEELRAQGGGDLFNWFARHDPSADRDKKPYAYLQWLCSQFTKTEHIKAHDLEKIKTALQLFDRYKAELPNRDIATYDVPSLLAVVAAYQGQMNLPANMNDESLAKLQTSVLYDGPAGSIVVPHTRFAADYLGQDAGWCIHSEKGGAFNGYNEEGPLFAFLCNDPVSKKQKKYLSHNSEDQEVVNRWDDPVEPDDWILIKKLMDEALEANAISISTLVLGAGIPLGKIPKYKTRMTEQDAFDLAMFDGANINKIPEKYLSVELCAAFVMRKAGNLQLLPEGKQTLRLKMLAASLHGAVHTNIPEVGNVISQGRFLLGYEEEDIQGPIRDLSGWPLPYIISTNPQAILELAPENMTEQLKSIALSNSRGNLDLPLSEHEKALLYLSVISSRPEAIAQVPKEIKTEGFLVRAVHINPKVFNALDREKQTSEVRMAYAEKTGEGTDKASEKYIELINKFSPTGKIADMNLAEAQAEVLAAMDKDMDAYTWLPLRLRSYEIYKKAIARNHRDHPEGIAPLGVFQAYPDLITPEAFLSLPEELRSEELCLAALKIGSGNSYYLPKALLRDRNFILKAIPLAPNVVGGMEMEDVDSEIVDLCISHDPKPRSLWWKIPNVVWTKRYADEAANAGVEILSEYVPKKYHSYELFLKAAEKGLHEQNLYWARIPYKFWDLNLARVALLSAPLAISLEIANDGRPAIPREVFTPDYLIELGQAFLALKGKSHEEKQGMPYAADKYDGCPSDYFTHKGPRHRERSIHKYDPASLFAPHIQVIDPEGYSDYFSKFKLQIEKISKEGARFNYGRDNLLRDCEIPKAYCDSNIAVMYLKAQKSFGKEASSYYWDDEFFKYFSSDIFTQEVFDLCCDQFPGFFIQRVEDSDSWEPEYEINPAYTGFVQARHIQDLKKSDRREIREFLQKMTPQSALSVQMSPEP